MSIEEGESIEKTKMLCPKCCSKGLAVPIQTVRHLLKESARKKVRDSCDYFLCFNDKCKISYFSKQCLFLTTDLTVKLWFKDGDDDVPICYCSNLTRGEIAEAVKKGCVTIDAVQKHTGKNITGQCIKKNPAGKCCRNVFLNEIEKALRKNRKEESTI